MTVSAGSHSFVRRHAWQACLSGEPSSMPGWSGPAYVAAHIATCLTPPRCLGLYSSAGYSCPHGCHPSSTLCTPSRQPLCCCSSSCACCPHPSLLTPGHSAGLRPHLSEQMVATALPGPTPLFPIASLASSWPGGLSVDRTARKQHLVVPTRALAVHTHAILQASTAKSRARSHHVMVGQTVTTHKQLKGSMLDKAAARYPLQHTSPTLLARSK